MSFLEAEVYALTAAGVGLEEARALFARLREAVSADTDRAAAAQMIADEPDPMLQQVLERIDFRFTDESYSQLRAWIDYAPDDDLRKLRTPALAIYGTQDTVTPVQTSLDRLARLAPAVQNQVFPGADHRLRISRSLAPGYLDAVTTWCTAAASEADQPAR